MPDGGIRRVWATKAGNHYHCALEICTAEQEAARARLFDADAGREAPRREDIESWSGARFDQLRTDDAQRAFEFLGRDETARYALLQADPELERDTLR